MGLHFLAFWPCGPSFPFILAFSGSASGPPPTSCQKWPVCPTSLQWIYQRRDRLHFAVFSILGLHFLAFWPCGPSFPCILALWAFISLHFGLVGLHFLSFWPFRGRLLGPPPQVAKNGPFAQRPYNGFYQRRDRPRFAVFSTQGLHFLAFWPWGPSFPCILALWAFISLHFGLVGLHFLAFWPCGSELVGPPPTSCQKRPVFPMSHIKNLAAPGPGFIFQFSAFWAFISFHFGLLGLHLAFGSTLVKATLVSIYMCMQVCIMSVQFQRFTCIQNCANKNWRPISPDPGQRKPTPLRNPRPKPKKVKKLKQVFSIIIARACSTLVKAILLRMYARMCM